MATLTSPRFRKLGVVLLVSIGLFILWRQFRPYQLPPLDALLPTGELRVGIDPAHPPFAYYDSDGIISGLEPTLGEWLGERFNIPIRFVTLGYDGLYDALLTHQVDILIASVIVDPARTDVFTYSTPYFNAGFVLVSSSHSPIQTMSELEGKTLAFAYGSSAHEQANRWHRRLDTFIDHPYETAIDALDAVRLGESAGVLVEAASALEYLADHPTWQAHQFEVTVLPYAIVTRAEAGELSSAIDYVLRQILISPEWATLLENTFE